jgi:hypothetical protein
VACAGIVVMFARELGRVNASWMDNARTSEALATRARALATSAPDASVLLIDVPWRTIDAYLWAWALPFAVQPPFASEDLTRRTVILSHYWAYCCQQEPWWRDLEARVGRWATLRESGPIFLIGVSPERHIVTATEADVPGLRQALLEVASATTSAAAVARFQDLWRLANGRWKTAGGLPLPHTIRQRDVGLGQPARPGARGERTAHHGIAAGRQ